MDPREALKAKKAVAPPVVAPSAAVPVSQPAPVPAVQAPTARPAVLPPSTPRQIKVPPIQAPEGLMAEPSPAEPQAEPWLPSVLETPPLFSPQETGLADYAKREAAAKERQQTLEGRPDVGGADVEGNRPTAEERKATMPYDPVNTREVQELLRDKGVFEIVRREGSADPQFQNIAVQNYISYRKPALKQLNPGMNDEEIQREAVREMAVLKTAGLWSPPLPESLLDPSGSAIKKLAVAELPQRTIVGTDEAGFIFEEEPIASWVGHGFSTLPELVAGVVAPRPGQSLAESVAERRTLTTALPEAYPEHPYVAAGLGFIGDVVMPSPAELAVGVGKLAVGGARAAAEGVGATGVARAIDALGLRGTQVGTLAKADQILTNVEKALKAEGEALQTSAQLRAAEAASPPSLTGFVKARVLAALPKEQSDAVMTVLEGAGARGAAPRSIGELAVLAEQAGQRELSGTLVRTAVDEYAGVRAAFGADWRAAEAGSKTARMVAGAVDTLRPVTVPPRVLQGLKAVGISDAAILAATEAASNLRAAIKFPFVGADEFAAFRAAGVSEDLARKTVEGQRLIAAAVNEAASAANPGIASVLESLKKLGGARVQAELGHMYSTTIREVAEDLEKIQPELRDVLARYNPAQSVAFAAQPPGTIIGLPMGAFEQLGGVQLSDRARRYLAAVYTGNVMKAVVQRTLPMAAVAERDAITAATELQITAETLRNLALVGNQVSAAALTDALALLGIPKSPNGILWKAVLNVEGAPFILGERTAYLPAIVTERLAGEIKLATNVKTPMEAAMATGRMLMKMSLTRGSVLAYRPSYLLANAFDDAIQTFNVHGAFTAVVSTARSAFYDIVGIAVLSGSRLAEAATGSQLVGIAASVATGPAIKAVAAAARKLPRGLTRLPEGIAKMSGFDAMLSRMSLSGDVGKLLNALEEAVTINGKEYSYSRLYTAAVRGGVLETQAAALTEPGVFSWVSKINGGQEMVEYLSLRKRSGLFLTLVEGGMTPEQAAEGVVKALYDYKYSVTSAEGGIMRYVAPFWTWQKNAQRQTYTAFASPKGLYRMGVAIRGRHAAAQAVDVMNMADDYDQDSIAVGRMDTELAQQYQAYAEKLRNDMPNPQDRADFWRDYVAKGGEDPVAEMKSYWDDPNWTQGIPGFRRDAASRMGWLKTGLTPTRGMDMHTQEQAWYAALPPSGVVANMAWLVAIPMFGTALLSPDVDAWAMMQQNITDPTRSIVPAQMIAAARDKAPLDAGLAAQLLLMPGMAGSGMIDYTQGRYYLKGEFAVMAATQTGLLAASDQMMKGEMPYVRGGGFEGANAYLFLKSVGFPVGIVPKPEDVPALRAGSAAVGDALRANKQQ